MDIFTTALTRVVPVPIKPASLKVKALLKEAGTSKLKDDLDHLENHEHYFQDKNDNEAQSEQEGNEQREASAKKSTDTENTDAESGDKTGIKHLDIYV